MDSNNPLQHTKHIFRAALLLIGGLVVLALGRALILPHSWGKHGWFRGDNVEEQMAKAVVHGNDKSCKKCHEEAFKTHAEGKHQNVRCEVCHAPVTLHAEGKKKIAAMPRQKSRTLCLRCHRQLDARPKDFPQVNPQQHVQNNGGEWEENVCLQCHLPHSPL